MGKTILKRGVLTMKRKIWFRFAVVCLALVCCAAAALFKLHSEASVPKALIPSADEIMENGYPVNQNGETYGPDIKDWTGPGPDLMLAENGEGVVGYIRQSEVPGAQVSTLEEAVEYMKNRVPGPVPVNMYLEDGTTVIGEFLAG